jgi:cell division protein FtsN
MLKIQEYKNLEKLESPIQEINEDWKKYNKRLDSMLDNAQFGNELDNKKKIRTKNSKIAFFSIIGLALLILIFVQNKQNPNLTQSIINDQTSDRTKLVVTEDEVKKNHLKIKKNKTSAAGQINPIKEKSSNNDQAKSKEQIIPTQDKYYFIQVGAFSIKDNAIKLSKKINSKGFQTKISTGKIKLSKYQVFTGNFINIDDAALSSKKLKSLGFLPLILKSEEVYFLELGLFSKKQKATSLAKKLKLKGVKSNTKLIEANKKIYTVLATNLGTENKAQQTKKNLIKLGFKNSFIRYQ